MQFYKKCKTLLEAHRSIEDAFNPPKPVLKDLRNKLLDEIHSFRSSIYRWEHEDRTQDPKTFSRRIGPVAELQSLEKVINEWFDNRN